MSANLIGYNGKIACINLNKKNLFIMKKLPKGCQQCLKGVKTVLFLNGICQKPSHCSWYCPISEERRDKENTFANEIRITSKEELLVEINKINGKGMSITGGEPLSKYNLERTLSYIQYVKSRLGKKFHIHLYINGINFDEKIADKLVDAGLDEIRFHPPRNKWSNIEKILHKGICVGAELPVIPDVDYLNNLEEFIMYLENIGVTFINLNEFEYCFPNSQFLKERGFKLKEGTIASVVNSREFAFDLIKRLALKVSIKLHFCSIIAKDHYQLKNRYLRRARTIKLPYEDITEEGLLLYAQIEGEKRHLMRTHSILKSKFKISKKYVNFDGSIIKLPVQFALNEKFINLLDEYELNGYIVEIIPFRAPYTQITEKTPIKVFKEDVR